jgi:hypothetical protein
VIFEFAMLALGPAALAAQQQQQQPATFTATITADATKQPLTGALVVVGDTYKGVTDPKGHVQISGIPPGRYTVDVSDFSYRSESMQIAFAPGADVQGDIALLPAPIEITGLVVTAARRTLELAHVGFYVRRTQGQGSFADGDRIRRVAEVGGRVSDVLVGMRGMRVRPVGADAWTVLSSRYAGGCRPDVYVDRVPLGTSWRDINEVVPLSAVAGIEAYPSSMDAPPNVMPSRCGVILIWTDRGR